jgi:hypothetical protein
MEGAENSQHNVTLTISYTPQTPSGVSSLQIESILVLPLSNVEDVAASIRLTFGLAADEDILLEDSKSGGKLALSKPVLGRSAAYNLLVKRKPAAQTAATIFRGQHSAPQGAAASAASSSGSGSGAGQKAESDSAVSQYFPEYPDEDQSWTISVPRARIQTRFHTGWATEWKKSRDGAKYRKCIGVYVCSVAGCKFTRRPLTNRKRRKACADWTCTTPAHADKVCSTGLQTPDPSCAHAHMFVCSHSSTRTAA